jgi:hypothetical protein
MPSRPFTVLGLANVILFHARSNTALHAGSLPSEARIHALISLPAWIAALLAGRTIAYL